MKIILFVICFSLSLIPSELYSQAPDSLGVYSFVPEQPAFIGGDEALYKFINDSIQYPADALKEKKSGKVLARIVIDEKGEISAIKAFRGVCPSLDDEAIRVISLTSGKWESGKLSGKAVKTYKFIPVNFKIDTTADEIESQKMEFIGGDSAFFAFIKNNVQIPQIVAEADLWADSKIAVSFDSSNKITNIISGPGQQDLNDEAIRLIKLTQGYWKRINLNKKIKNITTVVTIHFTKSLIAPKGKNIVSKEEVIHLATSIKRDPLFKRAHDKYLEKDYSNALPLFEECIEKNHEYIASRFMRALCLSLLGRLENACHDLNWLVENNVKGENIEPMRQAICINKYLTPNPQGAKVIVRQN